MEKELEIISYFGLSNQLKKLNEECYELIEACWEDDGSIEKLEHIREEWEDVTLIMNQLFAFYELGKNKKKNEILYNYKKNRTLLEIEELKENGN